MEAERWQRVEGLYHAALERPSGERSAFLASACAGDDALRAEVESLLALLTRAERFIEEPAIEIAARSLSLGETPLLRMDRYQLLQKLGEGGMGEVWLAEQTEPVRRRVALKVVKAGMNTREVIARFESERQALALMDHPAIAKVFDAGSTPEGAPYFVMEYVEGVPVTAYCDDHRLSLRDRLGLFIQVCEGVQHAHQKAVIHRDLKPSNILVTEVDGRAAPKIIDFGVAKALTPKSAADTMFTRAGALVGTPEYMSPEQAVSSGEDIDTRSDVYSLGIILYELLAGVPPLDLRKISFEELLRRLREEEPPKPAARLRAQDTAAASEVARKRQSEPLKLAKQLRGDLDSIALKALEKDRARRYSSPSDLAADIRRYINKEAVLAVPPSVSYRAGKFIRRYRGALVTTAAFVLVLVAAAVISIRQSLRANREAAVAAAINDFLQNDLLAQASAATQSRNTRPDPDLKVRAALDRAASRIAGRFDGQPEIEAAIRDTIGQTYVNLGLYPEARAQLEPALALYRRVLGTGNPATLRTMSRLGYMAYLQGKSPEAEALLSEAVENQRRVLGSDQPDTLKSMSNLANVYWDEGKYTLAEPLHRQILEIRRRALGPEHPDTLSSMNNLGNVYEVEGKYDQAEALHSQKLEISRRVLGPEHPNTLNSMNNLANVYEDEGKYPQAEELHSQNLEIRRRVLGPEHPLTLVTQDNLALIYSKEGKYAGAEQLHQQTVETLRRVLGAEHVNTLVAENNLSNDYAGLGKYSQAEILEKQTLEIERRTLGPENRWTLVGLNSLAAIYADEGRYSQAETLFNQALDARRRVLGNEHLETLQTLSQLAFLYQIEGKYAQSETYAAEALAGRRHAFGSDSAAAMAAAADLAMTDLSQGKFKESEALSREATELERKKQPDHWQRFRAESLLGASLAGQKKYGDAEPLLLEGYRGMLERKDLMGVPNWYYLDRAREWVAEAAKWKKNPR